MSSIDLLADHGYGGTILEVVGRMEMNGSVSICKLKHVLVPVFYTASIRHDWIDDKVT